MACSLLFGSYTRKTHSIEIKHGPKSFNTQAFTSLVDQGGCAATREALNSSPTHSISEQKFWRVGPVAMRTVLPKRVANDTFTHVVSYAHRIESICFQP
jgi:hypothetical protein